MRQGTLDDRPRKNATLRRVLDFFGRFCSRCGPVDDIANVVGPGHPLSIFKDVRLEGHVGPNKVDIPYTCNIHTVFVGSEAMLDRGCNEGKAATKELLILAHLEGGRLFDATWKKLSLQTEENVVASMVSMVSGMGHKMLDVVANMHMP